MKSSALIAVAAAGVLSASAAACPAYGPGKNADGASRAVRTLLHSTTTSTCTPRMYWFPAECSTDRSVASAAKATHGTKAHVAGTSVETCLPRIYWFPAHCQ